MEEHQFKPGQRVRNKYLNGNYETLFVGVDPSDKKFGVVVFTGSRSYEGWTLESIIPAGN